MSKRSSRLSRPCLARERTLERDVFSACREARITIIIRLRYPIHEAVARRIERKEAQNSTGIIEKIQTNSENKTDE